MGEAQLYPNSAESIMSTPIQFSSSETYHFSLLILAFLTLHVNASLVLLFKQSILVMFKEEKE